MFYENQKDKELVQNYFVQDGLEKNESCIIMTHDNEDFVKVKMKDFGIDVDSFMEKNMLRIYQMDDLSTDLDGVERAFGKFLQKAYDELSPPYRIIGLAIKNISTSNGIKDKLDIEKDFHAKFENHNCICLCTYHTDSIEQVKRAEWIKKIIENHHKIIFASTPEASVDFDTHIVLDE